MISNSVTVCVCAVSDKKKLLTTPQVYDTIEGVFLTSNFPFSQTWKSASIPVPPESVRVFFFVYFPPTGKKRQACDQSQVNTDLSVPDYNVAGRDIKIADLKQSI